MACWIAPRDVTPGKNYGAAIVDAIDECPIFVLVLSAASNKSGQVVREVERAATNDAVIIPFRVEDVQPSRNLLFYVSAAHWLDAVAKPRERHLRELLRAIKDWQEDGRIDEWKEMTPAPPPPSSPLARRFSSRTIAIAGVAAAVLISCAIVGYKMVRYSAAQRSQREIMASMATTMPKPEATALAERFEPSRPPTEPVESAPAAAPPRRRPGESRRAASESAAAVTPVIREVAASSELKVGETTRRAGHAFDGNASTVWVGNGDGVGQSITAYFNSPATVRSVAILKSADVSEEHYYLHNRVQTVRMTLSDGTIQLLTFEDKMKWQRFDLPKPAMAEWARFEIVTVYRGQKFNYTPLAEIAFNREPPDPAPESATHPQSAPRRPGSPLPKPGP